MSKTAEAIAKITGKNKETIESFSALIAIATENNNEEVRNDYAKKLRGYLKCLFDLNMITQSELRCLYLYYFTNGDKFRKRKQIEYVEYVGNVYEVYEKKENTTVIMGGDGKTIELPNTYFETLRSLKEEDISR